jgi:hypothetical protein
MATKLSLRALWTLYKRTAIAQGIGGSKRDLTLAHVAFYFSKALSLKPRSRRGSRPLLTMQER